ncbi:MAG: glycosyl transferase, partial [Pseudomonadales bacterium]
LKATYYRQALDFLEAYYHDAIMNGLTLDRDGEERAVELFSANILSAGERFLERPQETPFIPSWNRIQSADPDIFEKLRSAVSQDAQDAGGPA